MRRSASRSALATLGIDEAGRGPVFGPLVVAAFWCSSTCLAELTALGVRDSKLVPAARRQAIYDELQGRANAPWCFDSVHVPSAEIDARRLRGESLNEIEQTVMLALARRAVACRERGLRVTRVQIDSVDRNTQRFAAPFVERLAGVEVVCATGADKTFVCVAAASIVAKVQRDRAIEELARTEGAVGSGYTHDAVTRLFLADYHKRHGHLPPWVRRTWKMHNQAGFD